MIKKFSRSELIIAFSVLALFIIVSVGTYVYADVLRSYIGGTGYWGMVVYVSLIALSVVIAPVSEFPLLPIAVAAWGSFTTALLNIAGWTIGSVIAFGIARSGGAYIKNRLWRLEKIQQLTKQIPEKNLFVSIVFLRITIPVDIISYAIGLCTTVSWPVYGLATLIGVTPIAFVTAYALQMPLEIQLAMAFIGLLVVAAGYFHLSKKYGRKAR